jgi:hypothetical protein
MRRAPTPPSPILRFGFFVEILDVEDELEKKTNLFSPSPRLAVGGGGGARGEGRGGGTGVTKGNLT